VIATELRHLRYFVAIAEDRSFTRAAERLWVAQPGLSSQIRRLETKLGITLFMRHTRGVDLTDAGELFLERARTVLAAAADALAHRTRPAGRPRRQRRGWGSPTRRTPSRPPGCSPPSGASTRTSSSASSRPIRAQCS
jgi:DNA-binding transcriptional LysR family regulator